MEEIGNAEHARRDLALNAVFYVDSEFLTVDAHLEWSVLRAAEPSRFLLYACKDLLVKPLRSGAKIRIIVFRKIDLALSRRGIQREC